MGLERDRVFGRRASAGVDVRHVVLDIAVGVLQLVRAKSQPTVDAEPAGIATIPVLEGAAGTIQPRVRIDDLGTWHAKVDNPARQAWFVFFAVRRDHRLLRRGD